jgi:hypothetical protein
MRVNDLCRFIKARENERLRKLGRYKGAADPIIAQYRFCNVRRNDDKVTLWVFQNILEPNEGDPFLWFRLVIARLLNLPDSLEEVTDCMVPFKPELFRKLLHFRKDRGLRNFNAAYIVSTNGRPGDKVDYLVKEVLQPLWAIRHNIAAALKGATLAEAHELLMRQNGLGSFMAAQVLADLKYAHPERWSDFDTFAASGPGSKRGLNRIFNRSVTQGLTEGRFREDLTKLRKSVNSALRGWEPLTAQDIQNCLCEFDKYERARMGEGTPKQLYGAA